MDFQFVENRQAANIKVIGVGGAGNNAINNMISAGLEGVIFIAANTDLQALEASVAPVKLQLGEDLTKGLGSGANPEIGRAAAMEDKEQIQEILGDCDMLFITAGMGKGTGTGGAPVIAEVLKELPDPPLTVAVVTKPFHFEGKQRQRHADNGIEQLKEFADTIITIPNDRLLTMAPRGCSVQEAFRMADNVLLQAVKGISDVILLPGLVNVDFQDAKNIMSNKGQALMGTGIAAGPDRAVTAAQAAISSPLLEDISIEGAQGILINISARENEITLDEVDQACSLIQKEADADANIIFGVAWDNSLEDKLRITVIATGIGQKRQPTVINDPKEKKRVPISSLSEIDINSGALDQPTFQRKAEPPRSLRDFKGPKYSKYESYAVDEEDLEKPTFLRRKAD